MLFECIPGTMVVEVLSKSFVEKLKPRKMNDPIGRRGSFRSARERLNALLMAITASSWPMTCCFRQPCCSCERQKSSESCPVLPEKRIIKMSILGDL